VSPDVDPQTSIAAVHAVDDVVAGAEGPASTGDHHHSHRGVPAGLLDRFHEPGNHLPAQRVEAIGPVERERQHPSVEVPEHPVHALRWRHAPAVSGGSWDGERRTCSPTVERWKPVLHGDPSDAPTAGVPLWAVDLQRAGGRVEQEPPSAVRGAGCCLGERLPRLQGLMVRSCAPVGSPPSGTAVSCARGLLLLSA
jgi:hypothetical protein